MSACTVTMVDHISCHLIELTCPLDARWKVGKDENDNERMANGEKIYFDVGNEMGLVGTPSCVENDDPSSRTECHARTYVDKVKLKDSQQNKERATITASRSQATDASLTLTDIAL